MQLQKLEWWSLERELRQARESDVMSMLTEQDIEDAEGWMASPSLSQSSASSMPSFYENSESLAGNRYYDCAANEEEEEAEDERMAEILAMQEEAEMEALIASMEAESAAAQAADAPAPSSDQKPASIVYSDDEDYDALFGEILSGADEDTEMDSF